MLLSVCMIVRDEARLLPRCLESIAGVYDELCIVDTGSTDATVTIAKGFGAIVQQCMECNGADGLIRDFSLPRNVALGMASGKWVLQLDADEVVRHGRNQIRLHAEVTAGNSIAVLMRSVGQEWLSVRLFRRSAARGYVSRVHEYVELDGEATIDRTLVIENLPNKINKESSGYRNIRLCEDIIREDQNNGRAYYYLGGELRAAGEYDRAIDAYEAMLKTGNFIGGRAHSAYYLGICHYLKGDWKQAIEAGKLALRYDSRRAEGCCLIADSFYAAGARATARRWYAAALSLAAPPPDCFLPSQAWAYDEHPREQIRKIDLELKEVGETHQQ